eukprot:Amastigsp_a677559_27.p4 type:complete len:132 gc:universal Amastigsp_a677559_27:227-622(+)
MPRKGLGSSRARRTTNRSHLSRRARTRLSGLFKRRSTPSSITRWTKRARSSRARSRTPICPSGSSPGLTLSSTTCGPTSKKRPSPPCSAGFTPAQRSTTASLCTAARIRWRNSARSFSTTCSHTTKQSGGA